MFTKATTKTGYGMKQKDLPRAKYYIFEPIEIGEYDELKKKARKYNRITKRLQDRTYFVWPVAGPLGQAQLVVGHFH